MAGENQAGNAVLRQFELYFSPETHSSLHLFRQKFVRRRRRV